ncbi:MAG: aspartate kinase [Bdellovibrionales bacterium]|nr:aspartate kinase [Bdellovibrionales bacterium]
MAFLVQKYGGTSVATPERIRAVAEWIARTRAEGNRLVVVVSAMGHTTDELLKLASQVNANPPYREVDMLLSTGERISMALLSMALAAESVPAVSLTGSQSGIITDGHHRRARILRITGNRIQEALDRGQVVIVAGFQGVSEAKEITTLGRGGSDTTAVGLAIALKADVCEIYTDVDGVYSADPRLVREAHFLPQISYDLMCELAQRGAGVLHSRCVYLSRKFGMPLRVLNSLGLPDRRPEGTRVGPPPPGERRTKMESGKITAVTADSGRVFCQVTLQRPSLLGTVWDALAEMGVTPLVPVFGGMEMSFFIGEEWRAECQHRFNQLQIDGFVKSFRIDSGLAPLSVLGENVTQDPRLLSRVFEVLARENIEASRGVMTGLAITVAVPTPRVDDGVKALHQELMGS